MVRTRWLIFILIGLMVVGAISVVSVLLFTKIDQAQVLLEITKALLDIIVVGVIGSLITLLVRNYQRYQDAIDKEKELKRNILEQLDQAYRSVKTIRRALKAKAIKVGEGNFQAHMVAKDVYDAQMNEMQDTQLDLEDLVRDVESFGNIFSSANQIKSNIASMEAFLREITREYEDIFSKMTSEKDLSLDQLKCLEDIVGPYRASKLRMEFMHKYKSARQLILRDVLKG